MSEKCFRYARQQELEVLAYLAEDMDADDYDPGVVQVLRDLDAELDWVVL